MSLGIGFCYWSWFTETSRERTQSSFSGNRSFCQIWQLCADMYWNWWNVHEPSWNVHWNIAMNDGCELAKDVIAMVAMNVQHNLAIGQFISTLNVHGNFERNVLYIKCTVHLHYLRNRKYLSAVIFWRNVYLFYFKTWNNWYKQWKRNTLKLFRDLFLNENTSFQLG